MLNSNVRRYRHNLRNHSMLRKNIAVWLPLLLRIPNRLYNLLMPVKKKGYSILPFDPDTYE